MTKRLLVLFLLVLPLAGALDLSAPHLCLNTPISAPIENVSFGRGGFATDSNLSTGVSTEPFLVLDFGQPQTITNYNITATSNNCGCTESLYLEYLNDASVWTPARYPDRNGNAQAVLGGYCQLSIGYAEVFPRTARYWRVRSSGACPGAKILELNLSAYPQQCQAKFAQLVSVNESNLSYVYNEVSLNDSKNNRVIALRMANGSGIELASDYGGFQRSPLSAFQSSDKVTYLYDHYTNNGNCDILKTRSFDLATNSLTPTFADTYHSWDNGHSSLGISYNASNLFLQYSDVADCAVGGWNQISGRIFNSVSGALLRSQVIQIGYEIDAWSGFQSGSEGRLLKSPGLEIRAQTIYWNNFSLGPDYQVYNSSGNDNTPYYFDNGSHVLFSSDEQGPREIYYVPADCNNVCTPVQVTNDSSSNKNLTSVLDDGDSTYYAYVLNNSNASFYGVLRLAPYAWNASSNNSNASQLALLSLSWEDAYGLLNYTISTNSTGTWTNYTGNASGTSVTVNASITLNDSVGNVVTWKSWAFDSQNKSRESETYYIVITDGQPPQYGVASVNTTAANATALVTAAWTDDYALDSYWYEYDNGDGSPVVLAPETMIGDANFSAFEVQLNATENASIVLRVYANDSYGNSNYTELAFNTTDSTPPTLSGFVLSATTNFITYGFNADEPVNHSTNFATASTDYLLSHSGTITGLAPNTAYSIEFTACDVWANCVKETRSTTTQPTPTPAAPSGGSGGGSPSSFYATPTPLPSPSPSPTPVPSPLPTVSPSPTPMYSPEPFFPPEIKIDLSDDGTAEITVESEGEPESGKITIRGPGEKSFEQLLDEDGKAAVVLDEPGEWTIQYGDTSKSFNYAPKPIEPSKGTGFFFAGFDPLIIVGLLLALAAAAYVYKTVLVPKPVILTRSVDGRNVLLRVHNNGGDLTGLRLTELSQNKSAQGAFKTDTVLGVLLSWENAALEKGEEWVVEYSVTEGAPDGSCTELTATTSDGKPFKITL
ncbi:hypothetical protein AUJ14_04160 [Candidatus Micrarchaeota archaeon CG1_02_55_22]|nr:MAG: hypothetical protein AUJ14_04160 [Candidatus Micrarchaeota archaeon CG1_02_55_22]